MRKRYQNGSNDERCMGNETVYSKQNRKVVSTTKKNDAKISSFTDIRDIIVHSHFLICKQIVDDLYVRIFENEPVNMDVSVTYRAYNGKNVIFLKERSKTDMKNQRNFVRTCINTGNESTQTTNTIFKAEYFENIVYSVTDSNGVVKYVDEQTLIDRIFSKPTRSESDFYATERRPIHLEISVAVRSKTIRRFIKKFYQNVDKKTLNRTLYDLSSNHNLFLIKTQNVNDTMMAYWGRDDYVMIVDYHNQQQWRSHIRNVNEYEHKNDCEKMIQDEDTMCATPQKPETHRFTQTSRFCEQFDKNDESYPIFKSDIFEGRTASPPIQNQNHMIHSSSLMTFSKQQIVSDAMLLDIFKGWAIEARLRSRDDNVKDFYSPTQLRKKLHDYNYAFWKPTLEVFLQKLIDNHQLCYDPLIQKNQNVYYLP